MNMVGSREPPLEVARSDPAMDVIGAMLIRLAAAGDQHILVAGDLDFVAPDRRMSPK
jgi:hypothetical protein